MDKFKFKSWKESTRVTIAVAIVLFFSGLVAIEVDSINDSAIAETGFFHTSKLLISLGITFTLLSIGGMPKKYYKSNDEADFFAHFKQVFILRISLGITGIILCLLGSKSGNIAFIENESIIGVVIELFILLMITIAIINWMISLIKNRKDFLLISNQKIAFFDDDTGDFEISVDKIKSINLVYETYTSSSGTSSDNLKKIEIEKEDKNKQIIDLEMMSLTGYDDLIDQSIKSKFKKFIQ